MGSNLPNVPVNDLVLYNAGRKLVAATFGRSMYSYDLYQDTLTTGVYPENNLQFGEINCYPNPFATELNISIEAGNTKEEVQITVINSSGKEMAKLYKGRLSDGMNTFRWKPQHSISKGIYYIVIHSRDKKILRKVIFQS